MKPQLYMWSGTRDMFVRRHDFYVEQIKAKVLAQFADIEADAERHGTEEFERLGRRFGDGSLDEGSVADMANDRAQLFYGLLSDLREQVVLGALAGLYHQWDKDLRDFLERELSHNFEAEDVKRLAWKSNAGDVFDILKQFGWDAASEAFFPDLDACRLIVNVFKHGKGSALDKLASSYPQFLKSQSPSWPTLALDHEMLRLSDTQFDDLATALRGFWIAFPERLFLP